MLSSLCFLILQVTVFFRPLCLPTTLMDYVFAFWAVAIALEELEQILSSPQLYAQSLWNVVDCIRAVVGLLVVVMRFVLAYGHAKGDGTMDAVEWWSQETGGWAHQGSWMLFDDSRLSTLDPERVCEWSWEMEALRTFASLLILTSTVRLLEALTFQKDTGVLLVCVTRMSSDLYNWAQLAMLISTGFGLVMHLLAPEYRLDGSPGAWRPFRIGWMNLDLDISSAGPFWMTAWGLLGFFEPGELSAAPGSAFFAPFALWCYLLIALVLFVNLLIAMFSRSYEEVMAQADTTWKLNRVLQVKSSMKAHACPPPFNLLTLPATLLYRLPLWCRERRSARRRSQSVGPVGLTGEGPRSRLGFSRKVQDTPSPGGGGGGGGGPGGGGGSGGGPGGDGPGGRGNPRGVFKRTATSFTAEMDEGEKDVFAAWTFPAAKAQAVEDRARRAFLDYKEREEEEHERVPRKLEHLEKLVLEVTEATVHAPRRNSSVAAAVDKLEPPPRRDSNALAAAVSSVLPPPRRSLLLPVGGRAEGMTPFHAKLDTLSQQVQSQGQQLQQALDALGQLTRGLAAGSARADSARATLG